MLIRADSGGGTHGFLARLARRGRRLQYPVGFTLTRTTSGTLARILAATWTPPMSGTAGPAWRVGYRSSRVPMGMRVIVRKESPHPGAQLRFTDIGGHRSACFAPNTKGGQLADLELRHRVHRFGSA